MRSIQWSAQVERFTLSSSSRKACHAAKYVVMQHTSSMGSCGRTEIERKRITIFSGCAFRFLDVTSVDILCLCSKLPVVHHSHAADEVPVPFAAPTDPQSQIEDDDAMDLMD